MAPKPQIKDDPNTFIPPAVRRAAEQADAAFRAQPGRTEPVPEKPPELAGVVAPEAAAPPPAPQQEVPAASPGEPPPGIEQPPPQDTWEHKYKSMEGRYKRAEADLRSMGEQFAAMQSQLTNLSRKQASDAPPELRPQSLLTPEEVNEYGDDFLSVVAKKAKEEFSPEVMALKHQISSIKQQLDGAREQNLAKARLDLEASLDQRLPQWRDINVMQEFHSWLALPDTYSGANRHDLLRSAYEQGNTPRVLAFFKGFLDQEAALAPQGGPDQANGKIPLESFAAPGRAKTAAASGAPAEKPIFTNAQIARFYAESAAGKWRGREEEYNRIDRAIIEAGREGRVR